MSAVYPIMLGGLGLLAVPILIHLIYRQKPRVLKFPAFRFLMKRSRTNLRKLQLRHLLLLILRVLVLALICLALVRPKISGELVNLQTDRPVAAIFLFDTSYSMQYKTTGDKSRLDEARQQALQLLETLHPQSRIVVLDTAEPASPGTIEWLSRDKAEVQIKSLALRYDNQPVTRRLDDAYQLFGQLALATEDLIGPRLPRVLCVFSDRMESCWDPRHLPHLQGLADAIPPLLERLPAVQGSIPGRIALLQELRDKLPPPAAQDYPEKKLIAAWEELQQRIPAATWDNYPDQQWVKILGEIRATSRDLLKKLQVAEGQDEDQAKKTFRKKIVASLEGGLQELQGVATFFIDVGLPDAVDLGIAAVDCFAASDASAPRQTFGPKEKIRVQVMLRATGAEFDNSLKCLVDGKLIHEQQAKLGSGESKTLDFDLDAGTLEPGYKQLELKLSAGDPLEFTNHRFATILIRSPRHVLIVTDDKETAQPLRDYIAANPIVQFQCEVKTPDEAEKLGPGKQDLAKYHAIYLLNVAQPTANLWKALKSYVDQGGNVAIVPGGKAGDEKAILVAYKNGGALLPAALTGIIEANAALLPGDAKQNKDKGAVWDWSQAFNSQHRFFKRFRHWHDIGRDDFIKVPRYAYRFWEVAPPEKVTTVLVHYNTKKRHPAILERDFGKGRGKVLLVTTRLDFPVEPAWNNYLVRDHSWAAVFPGELTIYLAGELEPVKLNFVTGQTPPTVTIPPGVTDQVFNLIGPLLGEQVPRPEKNELILHKAVVPGNYALEASPPPEGGLANRIGAFSVNLPAEEGSLKPVPLEEITALFGNDAVRNLKPGDTVLDLPGLFSTPLELLPGLMLALLVFLALENLLANLFYRREPRPQPEGEPS
jgi:hypothetical protein